MAQSFDLTALETLNLLQRRLERIEFALCGDADAAIDTNDNQVPIIERFLAVEQKFQQLVLASKPLKELLSLYSTHPDLFQASIANGVPAGLDMESILSIINASANVYSETASMLSSIIDIPIPSTELSAQLTAFQPRISKIEAIQVNQHSEVMRLRERSAALIERWYMTNILDTGEVWASLDTRVRHIEQKIRQVKLAKRRDETI